MPIGTKTVGEAQVSRNFIQYTKRDDMPSCFSPGGAGEICLLGP